MHSNRAVPHGWRPVCFKDRVLEGGMAHNFQTDGITEDADQRILVVEDGDAVRKMICAMLMQNGYQCLEAADGEEALHVLHDGGAGKVSLVLTDLMMPGMNGAELARHIAQN